jgi:predicted nucleic acid-binding protein
MEGRSPDAYLAFIDTWGWLALGHRRDAHHQEINALYKELRSGGAYIYTTDYVLDEVMTLIFRREAFEEAVRFMEGIFRAVEARQLIVERITSDRFASAWRLRKRLQDKPKVSFTDLTSMIVMKERGINDALTEDEHFIQVGMGFRRLP